LKYGDLLEEEGTVVRHLNGDQGNAWDNIAIGTMSDNMFDIPKQIRIRRAEHASSLSQHDHVKIKQWHINNRHKNTMIEFDISSKGTLNYILKKS
jgi:hypothetical protein